MNTQISDLSQISVAILAGGPGTRLQPVLKGKPKVLADVRSRPFLEYILHQLNQSDFKKVVLCTGYLSQQVEKILGERYKNLRLIYSPEETPLGTAGCLRLALPLLTSKAVLVMNGDSFCEVDFKKFWRFHLNKNSQASLVLSKVSDADRFGKVKLKDDNSIAAFQEKKPGGGAGLINAGIYLINKAFIAAIPKNKVISIENIFPKWIGKGFYGYKSNNNFIDIGIPESYAYAQKFFTRYVL